VPQLSLDGPSAPHDGVPASHSRSSELPRGLRRRLPILAGLALGGLAITAVVCIGRSGDDLASAGPRVRVALPVGSAPDPVAPAAPSTPPPAAAPAAPSAPPVPAGVADRPALIVVKVRVSPDSARIAIDGAEVAGNPFSGKFAGDGAIHQVRATAPGFVARVVAVEFTTSVTLDVSLEHAAPRAATVPHPAEVGRAARPAIAARPGDRGAEPAAAPARPDPPIAPAEPRAGRDPKPPPDGDEVNPAGGNPPRRPIDRNDPYGESQ